MYKLNMQIICKDLLQESHFIILILREMKRVIKLAEHCKKKKLAEGNLGW